MIKKIILVITLVTISQLVFSNSLILLEIQFISKVRERNSCPTYYIADCNSKSIHSFNFFKEPSLYRTWESISEINYDFVKSIIKNIDSVLPTIKNEYQTIALNNTTLEEYEVKVKMYRVKYKDKMIFKYLPSDEVISQSLYFKNQILIPKKIIKIKKHRKFPKWIHKSLSTINLSNEFIMKEIFYYCGVD